MVYQVINPKRHPPESCNLTWVSCLHPWNEKMMTSCAAVCAKCPIIHARDFGAIRIGTAFVSACGVAASGKIPVGTVEAMQTIIISFFRYEETHCTHCVGADPDTFS